ncbi:DUF2804 domain-containing protein [Shewanella maritima]|uniref:DUF2804 domain-containing protein n=1 Tax=Shewanella maritima TaxID=2520507 RepID=UPI00373690AA
MANSTQISTQIAPEQLINTAGKPEFGHFDGVIKSLGVADFNYFNVMDKPASSLKKHFDFKQFQFVSIRSGRYLIGVAIADIRYLGSGFFYVFDISANHLVEQTWLKPPQLGYQMSESPYQGLAYIGGGKKRVSINIIDAQWHIDIQTKTVVAKLRLCPPSLSLPMSLCTPTAYNGWTYTQKHNGLSVQGELEVNHEPQPLLHALASYDFSAGFMRRQTSWRWASFNAQSEHGVLGLNLAAGVNETGANENVFWVNGERHLLPAVQFDFERENAMANWHVNSANGQVSLNFKPVNLRQEKLNLYVLKSNFRQYMGYFDGHIIDNHGQKHLVQQQLGLTEDHYAKW